MVRFALRKPAREESGDPSERLATVLEPNNVASEDYRTLRTNLLYSDVDASSKVIVVTSPGPSEGKSTTCANLAVVLAQADQRTLVMDCDLRKPIMHGIFGTLNVTGLVDVLAGMKDLSEVWQEPLPGLKVVTAGPVPPNPAELLGSRRFAELVDQVRKEFDYVLLDTPPIGLVSDPAILATKSDGVLLILNARKTRKRALRESVRSLEAVGAHVLGTVMNGVKRSRSGYYGYRYGDGQSQGW